MNKTVNFFSTSDNERYNMFIIPHILSVLHHVENSYVEIAIKNEKPNIENNQGCYLDSNSISDYIFKLWHLESFSNMRDWIKNKNLVISSI